MLIELAVALAASPHAATGDRNEDWVSSYIAVAQARSAGLMPIHISYETSDSSNPLEVWRGDVWRAPSKYAAIELRTGQSRTIRFVLDDMPGRGRRQSSVLDDKGQLLSCEQLIDDYAVNALKQANPICFGLTYVYQDWDRVLLSSDQFELLTITRTVCGEECDLIRFRYGGKVTPPGSNHVLAWVQESGIRLVLRADTFVNQDVAREQFGVGADQPIDSSVPDDPGFRAVESWEVTDLAGTGGILLPHRMKYSTFGSRKTTTLTSVSKVELNAPELDTSELDHPPVGTEVLDARTGEGYTVGAANAKMEYQQQSYCRSLARLGVPLVKVSQISQGMTGRDLSKIPCGPMAVMFLCHMNGNPITPSEVFHLFNDDIESPRPAHSMDEVCNGLNACGFGMKCVRCGMDDLRNLSSPVIARVKASYPNEVAGSDYRQMDHFTILLPSRQPHTVRFISPPGKQAEMSEDEFQKEWYGEAIVDADLVARLDESQRRSSWTFLASAAGAVLVLGGITGAVRRNSIKVRGER